MYRRSTKKRASLNKPVSISKVMKLSLHCMLVVIESSKDPVDFSWQTGASPVVFLLI